MNIKELLEKRAALLAELQKPETTAERFAEIRSEVDKINFTIEQLKKDDSDKRAEEARKAAEEADERAARLPNKGGVIYDAHELRVKAAEINDFRVRRYNITFLPRAELAHRQVNGLFFCNCVELHA